METRQERKLTFKCSTYMPGTVQALCKHFHLVLTIVLVVDNYPILQMWKLRLRKWFAQVTKRWHTVQICAVP